MAAMMEYMKNEIKIAIENAQSDKEKAEVLKGFCDGFVRNSKGQVLDGIGDALRNEAIRDMLATMDKSQIESILSTLPKQNQDKIKEIMGEMSKEEPIKDEAVQEAPVQETPVQEASVQEAPVQEAPAQEAPAQEAPSKEDLVMAKIKSLSDRKKSQIISKGKIEINGKSYDVNFSDAAIVDIIGSMENPQEIYEVIKCIKDSFIMLDTVAEKQPENMKRIVRERGISNKKFAEWEAAKQEKVVAAEPEQPETVEEPVKEDNTIEETEKEIKKKSRGFSLNLGEYGKYVNYIERGDADLDTVSSILKSGFSQRKEISLLELLVSNMKGDAQMEAAFDAIGDTQKKLEVLQKLALSNEVVYEVLAEKNPELVAQIEQSKEQSKEEIGEKRTIKGLIKGLFKKEREVEQEKTPEVIDATYEMEEEQEKEQEGHHRQSRKFKEYASYIEKRDPVPGTAATIESLEISAEEKAILVEMLATKLGKEKETEILKYLTDEKLKAAVQGRPEVQVEVEQAVEEPEKETVKEEKHKYSHKFKEYASYIEKRDPVPGTAATIESLEISAEEKEKLVEMLIARLGKEKEPEILSAKAAFERGMAEAAKKAEAAKEAEAIKEQETADKKQPSPLRAKIKGMLAKIKEQIQEMEKVNEAIKEGMHKDAEMTKAEIGGRA